MNPIELERCHAPLVGLGKQWPLNGFHEISRPYRALGGFPEIRNGNIHIRATR
jgi:hypothetical protein